MNIQQQYPLEARKKFWKKILGQIIPFFFFSLFLGIVIGFILVIIQGGNQNLTTPLIIDSIVGFILIFALFIGIYSWYINKYIQTYYYSADGDFITIKKGVFTPSEIHVQYKKIQDVYVDQDLFDRILGLYDVHIASATASSGIEAHIDGVNKQSSEGLKTLFMESMKTGGSQQSMGNNPAGTSSQLATGPAVINLSETISNETYPILGRWLYVKILGTIIGVSIFWFLLFISFFTYSKNGGQTLAQDFGIKFGSQFILIYLTVIFVSCLIHIIYLLIWKKNYKFQFTPEYIFTHQGVIGISEKHVPYNTIQDVIMNQGFIDRLLGLYNVTIQNAANSGGMVQYRRGSPIMSGGVIIPGQSFAKATKLTEILKSTVLSKNSSGTGL